MKRISGIEVITVVVLLAIAIVPFSMAATVKLGPPIGPTNPQSTAQVAVLVPYGFNDPYYNNNKKFYDPIKFFEAWKVLNNNNITLEGVKIAFIDSGIHNHTDFTPNLLTRNFFSLNSTDLGTGEWTGYAPFPGEFYADVGNSTEDVYGHGTFHAGIVAAQPNNSQGIPGLDNVTLYALKAFGAAVQENGPGTQDDEVVMIAQKDDIVSAIQYSIQQGMDIIAMCFDFEEDDPVIQSAIQNAVNAGCMVVAQVGDNAQTIEHYPAGYENVTAVGATDVFNHLAFYSSYGYADIYAPGAEPDARFVSFAGYLGCQTPYGDPFTPNPNEYRTSYGSGVATALTAAVLGMIKGYGNVGGESIPERAEALSRGIEYDSGFGRFVTGIINAVRSLTTDPADLTLLNSLHLVDTRADDGDNFIPENGDAVDLYVDLRNHYPANATTITGILSFNGGVIMHQNTATFDFAQNQTDQIVTCSQPFQFDVTATDNNYLAKATLALDDGQNIRNLKFDYTFNPKYPRQITRATQKVGGILTVDNSPYEIDSPLVVPKGHTLMINEDVELKFKESLDYEQPYKGIQVFGSLAALGNVNGVKLGQYTPGKHWAGLKVEEDGYAYLGNCEIKGTADEYRRNQAASLILSRDTSLDVVGPLQLEGYNAVSERRDLYAAPGSRIQLAAGSIISGDEIELMGEDENSIVTVTGDGYFLTLSPTASSLHAAFVLFEQSYLKNFHEVTLDHATIVDVSQANIFLDGVSDLDMMSSIYWHTGITPGFLVGTALDPAQSSISYSDVHNLGLIKQYFPSLPTPNSIEADPFFSSPQYTLELSPSPSPCFATGYKGTNMGAFGADFTNAYVVPDMFTKIQDAINSAVINSVDVILVRAGNYTENIDFSGGDILLKSIYGPDVTFIDAASQDSVVKFTTQESRDAVLEGFSIRGGVGSANKGGGITVKNASPIIKNNIITSNTAIGSAGGGIFCEEGGVATNPLMIDNFIWNNTATQGGGIACSTGSAPEINSNTIYLNRAYDAGGGIYLFQTDSDPTNPLVPDPLITHNEIIYNLVGDGPNSGMSHGGGIYCELHDPTGFVAIINNIIAHNQLDDDGNYSSGGGIYGASSELYAHSNTIYRNAKHGYSSLTRVGIFLQDCVADFVNSILWKNSDDNMNTTYGMYLNGTSTALTVDFCDVEQGQAGIHVEPGSTLTWGNNNIATNPLFVNPDAYPWEWELLDLHIIGPYGVSPCIDVGNDSPGYPLPTVDIDGDPRTLDGGSGQARTDLGADEFKQ